MNESVQDEAVQTLTCLGLNCSQARVYFALVRNGISTAKETSLFSGVNRQEIYRIMPKLQELGLAEKIIGIPTRWRATQIKDGLSFLLERRKKETSEFQTKATKIINKFMENNKIAELQKEDCHFVMIPKNPAIIRRIRKKLEITQASNDVIGNVKTFNEMMYSESEFFKKALKRGVKFRFILYRPESEKSVLHIDQAFKNNPNLQIRYVTGAPSVAMVVQDKKEALLSTIAKDPNEAPSLCSTNPVFVATLHNYFELLWKTAHKNEEH
jgi:sugar-specific transcriptional regulator TrmB